MGGADELDLDAVTKEAWGEFQVELAEHLVHMEPGDAVVIDVEATTAPDEVPPCVQVAMGEKTARLEVSSNSFLTGPHRLTDAAEEALVGLGFSHPYDQPSLFEGPASPNWWIEVDTTGEAGSARAWDLARTAVRALREVLGVVHPAFLSSDPQLVLEASRAQSPAADDPLPDGPVVTFPTSRAELRAEVDAVLAGLTGSDPEHDEDDDVLVRRGGTAAWVRVHRHAPVVELFAIVVDEVTDQKAAQFELSVLNRGFGFVRYELMDDRVFARVAVPANPFVPSHLRHLLDVLFEAVERVGPDLAHRICAETDDTEDEDEEADARVASALRVVLELDAAEPGSVGPSLAAAICDHDQRLLVEVLTSARQVLGEAKAAAGRLQLEPPPGALVPTEDSAERAIAALQDALRLVAEARMPKRRAGGQHPIAAVSDQGWIDGRPPDPTALPSDPSDPRSGR